MKKQKIRKELKNQSANPRNEEYSLKFKKNLNKITSDKVRNRWTEQRTNSKTVQKKKSTRKMWDDMKNKTYDWNPKEK